MPGMAASFAISTGRSRRTSGSPPVTRSLVMPSRDGDAREPLDLLECQHLAARDELHALFGHAVEAADVAAVRDADAQVVVDAAEGVDERRGTAMACYFTASMRSMRQQRRAR